MASNVKVSSTVKLNTSKLSILDLAQRTAFVQTADATKTELATRQVMPFYTGDLQNSDTHVDESRASSGKVSVVTTAPQARRLYFHPEYNFRKVHNPNAGGKWFESFLHDEFIKEAFANRMKALGGL